MKGRVLVFPLPETSDPEGESLVKTLADGGLDGLVSVRQGKLFEIEVSTTDPAVARALITKMASEHLADLETEDVEILVPGAGPEAFGVVAVYDRRQSERRTWDRRSEADRRSGRDRRLDGLDAEEIEENRRTGSDRRDRSDRRSERDRRTDTDRRTGMDRRAGDDRRTIDDEDFSGPERRSWIRRRAD